MPETARTPVIDAHCHLSPSLLGGELIEMMDEAGVHKAVVFSVPFLWSLPSASNYHNTNDYIADVQREYPDRMIGFACVNPHVTAVAELQRCVKELGLRGVKLHPENHCFAVDSLIGGELMDAVAGLQREMGRRIPVLSHGMTTLGAMPDQFARLAGAYPDVSIVLAHGAGFQGLYFPSRECLRERENLFVDTAMMTADDSALIGTANLLGADRIVFGSDHFGRGQKNLYGNFFHVLERAFPKPEERQLILGGTMARILGLDE